jgi:predicted DsbA family dithiol-disulfide isomerase
MVNRVRADIEFAKSLGVTGTPTFLVGARLSDGTVRVTQRLRGAQSVESLQGSIEALLSRSPEK